MRVRVRVRGRGRGRGRVWVRGRVRVCCSLPAVSACLAASLYLSRRLAVGLRRSLSVSVGLCLNGLPISLSNYLSRACEGDDDAHPRRAQPRLDRADESGADAAARIAAAHLVRVRERVRVRVRVGARESEG